MTVSDRLCRGQGMVSKQSLLTGSFPLELSPGEHKLVCIIRCWLWGNTVCALCRV